MTKPREKTREELTAEIEESKKKIRQFENREKIIKQKLSVEERKARNHRLCKRGGFMESLVPELIAMADYADLNIVVEDDGKALGKIILEAKGFIICADSNGLCRIEFCFQLYKEVLVNQTT